MCGFYWATVYIQCLCKSSAVGPITHAACTDATPSVPAASSHGGRAPLCTFPCVSSTFYQSIHNMSVFTASRYMWILWKIHIITTDDMYHYVLRTYNLIHYAICKTVKLHKDVTSTYYSQKVVKSSLNVKILQNNLNFSHQTDNNGYNLHCIIK